MFKIILIVWKWSYQTVNVAVYSWTCVSMFCAGVHSKQKALTFCLDGIAVRIDLIASKSSLDNSRQVRTSWSEIVDWMRGWGASL